MRFQRRICAFALTWSVLATGRAIAQSVPVQLEGVGFERGNRAAPVTVVEFADFGCPACAQFARETWPAIDAEFVQRGKVRWIFVPFILGAFPHSQKAAITAVCAGEQGAFWQVHDRLYQEQRRWSAGRDPGAVLREIALSAGLDPAPFEQCYRGREVAQQVRQFTRLARQLAVRATPTFFVGTRRVLGALPIPLFRKVLVEAGAEP